MPQSPRTPQRPWRLIPIRQELPRTVVESVIDAVTTYEDAYFRTCERERRKYDRIEVDWPEYLDGPFHSGIHVAENGFFVVRTHADEFSVTIHEYELTLDQLGSQIAPAWESYKDDWGPELRSVIEQRTSQGVQFQIRRSHIGISVPGTDDEITFVPTKGVALVAFTNVFDAGMWNVAQAHADAVADVATFVAGLLLGVTENPNDADSFADATIGAFSATISAFDSLLKTSPPEPEIQSFLEDNPILLCGNYKDVMAQFNLGGQFVVDFLIKYPDDRYLLIEIEDSTKQLFTRSGDPTAHQTHATRQVLDWVDWLENARGYEQSSLPAIVDPETWVVMGRRPTARRERRYIQLANRRSPRNKVFTYDDLIEGAQQFLENLRRHSVRNPGVTRNGRTAV